MIQEHDSEPVKGLPGRLPEGERILWQGSPSWIGVARHVFNMRLVATYFAIVALWRAVDAVERSGDIRDAMLAATSLAPTAAAALGLLALLAWATARTTIYTITNRRVALRIGVALQLIVNAPFKMITSARLKPLPDGRGDIALEIAESGRFAYFTLWPHARPWRFTRTEPMLRAVPEAAKVAAILSDALLQAHPEGVGQTPKQRPAAQSAIIDTAQETDLAAGLAAEAR